MYKMQGWIQSVTTWREGSSSQIRDLGAPGDQYIKTGESFLVTISLEQSLALQNV